MMTLDTKAGPYNIEGTGPQTGRRIIEDGSTVNIGNIAYDERYATSLINGKPQGTVFGVDMIVDEEIPQVKAKWDMGLNPTSQAIIIGTGYAKVTTNQTTLELGTGTDADGAIKIKSQKRIRYSPGSAIYGTFTAAFPKLEDSNGDYTMGLGLYDFNEGYLLAQRRRGDILEYGFILINNGNELFVPYNGILPIDPVDLNNLVIYRLETGYLGTAPTNIYWRDTVNEIFKRYHRQVYNQRTTSVLKPDLPVGAFVRNEGNTNNLTLLNGSYVAGTIGGNFEFDVSARPQTYERDLSAPPGTDLTLFAFKNEEIVSMVGQVDITGIPTFRDFNNSVASQLLEVKLAALDNNKLVNVDLYIADISDIISGTFTPIKLGSSILEVSEDAVIDLTNAEKLEGYRLVKDGQNPDPVISTFDLLFPGKVAIFVYTTTSVTFDLSVFIKYQDLL